MGPTILKRVEDDVVTFVLHNTTDATYTVSKEDVKVLRHVPD